MKVAYFACLFVLFGSCQKEIRDSLNIPELILLTNHLTHVNRDKTRNDEIEVGKNPYDILEKGYTGLP